MTASRSWFRAAVCLLLCLPALGYAREVRDVTDARVKVSDQPKRIVTLAPSLGELAADLLATDLSRIVGVSDFTDYPPALKRVASVGPYHRFSIEKVVSLKPDVVFATTDGNDKDQITHLRELGVPVVVVSSSTLREVEDSMRMVGFALGAADAGQRMAEQLHRGVEHLREKAKGRLKKKVLLQLSDAPLVVAGRDSFLNEALSVIGAVNLYGDAPGRYPRPSIEDTVARNPEVIVIVSMETSNAAFFKAMADRWSAFTKVKAVQDKQVKILPGDTFLRPTLRLLEGVSLMERAIYGAR